jgi:transcriptional regulator with GAF, ATPase, and Fis domain
MPTGDLRPPPTGHRRPGGSRLAEMLSASARLLQAEPDFETTLEAVVAVTLSNVPGAEHAGITTLDKSQRPLTPAASHELVEAVDAVQYQLREGPCLSALQGHATMLSDDLADDERWPRFGPRAVELGVQSMVSFQLFVHAGTVGALNLYARDRRAFNEDSVAIGQLLAAHAAIAMVAARNAHEMKQALSTRDVIGQAKGILMERHKIGAYEAFGLLVRASQDTNRKLRDIAVMVTDTGVDPGSHLRQG